MHYFYARKWPVWLWMILIPLSCTVLMSGLLGSPPSLSPLTPEAKSYVLLLALAWMFGWAGGALVGPFILGPIHHHRAQLNGAPFQTGDLVQVLVGPYRGRVTRVLEPLDGQGLVKVDLAQQAQRSWKSRFWCGNRFEETQLLKITAAEQCLADVPQAARR